MCRAYFFKLFAASGKVMVYMIKIPSYNEKTYPKIVKEWIIYRNFGTRAQQDICRVLFGVLK